MEKRSVSGMAIIFPDILEDGHGINSPLLLQSLLAGSMGYWPVRDDHETRMKALSTTNAQLVGSWMGELVILCSEGKYASGGAI